MFLQTNDIDSKQYIESLGYKCLGCNCDNMYMFKNDENFQFNEDLYNYKISHSSKIRFDLIPYEHQLITDFDDDRFIPLTLRIQHDGLNFNKTVFDLIDMERAMPTLLNVPILGNIYYDRYGHPQLGSHDSYMIRDPNNAYEYKIIYNEKPLGVIPANLAEYKIEENDGRYYTIANGLLFRNYTNDAETILLRDKEIKLSMEIDILKSLNLGDGITQIIDYKYCGITLLGHDIEPAMDGTVATIKRKRRRKY